MTVETTVQLLIAMVAIYGAGLSTYTFVAQRTKKLKVSLSFGFLTLGPELSDSRLILQAANSGHRIVTLSGWSIKAPRGEQLLNPLQNSSMPFPCELADGKSVTCWLDAKEVAGILSKGNYTGTIRLVGEVRDATDKRFRSKSIKFDIDSWLGNG